MINKKVKMLAIQFITLCFLLFFLSLSQAGVTLTVGKGSALPGSIDSSLEVSLENQYDQVKGVQVDICDVDDYLSCTACETTDRTTDFWCIANERDNGCCRAILFSTSGDMIEVGEGSIFTLKYDVSDEAAPQECRALNPENVSVVDVNNQALDVTLELGSFCFPCTNNADCDDGLYCNGTETCVDGICQPGTDPCAPPTPLCDERNDKCIEECVDDADCDDGEFCNGDETCLGGYCQAGSDPCPGQMCDETLQCVDCLNDEDCDDGVVCTVDSCDQDGNCQNIPDDSFCDDSVDCTIDTCDNLAGCINISDDSLCDNGAFCDGAETCDPISGCQPGTDPCAPQLCDEGTDTCVDCLSDADCDDGVVCTMDSCDQNGNCQNIPDDSFCDDSVDCTIDTCDNLAGCINISDDSLCDNGAFCDGAETCDPISGCQPGTDPCPGQMCDETLQCVECLTNEDCDGASFCNTGVCEPIVHTTTTTKTPTTTTTPPPPPPPPRSTTTTVMPTTTTTISTPECEVTIKPSSATVSSGDNLTLVAKTTGEGCEIGDYEWLIDSEIGSVIDLEGNYSAGINNTGSQITDIITVVDHANSDINATATIIVENEGNGRIVTVFPKTLLGSRWIPLPYFLLIVGESTNFELSSTIEFEPDNDIIPLSKVGFGNIFLALIFLINSPQEGTVNFIINTGEEAVTGELSIELLPQPFTEDYSDIVDSYTEISLDNSI